jgi:DNA-binding NtrC family response regulator
MRVLLIEPCELDARVTLTLLHQAGIKATRIANPQEAGCKLKETDYDCTLLSVDRDSATFQESMELLQRVRGSTPVILITDSDDLHFFLASLQLHIDDYWIKGDFDETTILRSMLLACEHQRRLNELRRRVALLEALLEHKVGLYDAPKTVPDG